MVTQLQKRNIVLMILLGIITHGIYFPVWFLNRKEAFNNLESKEKISNSPIIFVLIIFIISAVMFFPSALLSETEMGAMIDIVHLIISLVGGITILFMSFKVGRIMNEHYKINLSGVATFFFTCFYLQYKINGIHREA